jgi:hypothetical protein
MRVRAGFAHLASAAGLARRPSRNEIKTSQSNISAFVHLGLRQQCLNNSPEKHGDQRGGDQSRMADFYSRQSYITERESNQCRRTGHDGKRNHQAEPVFHQSRNPACAVAGRQSRVNPPIPNRASTAPVPRSPSPRQVSSACATRHKPALRSAGRRSRERTH